MRERYKALTANRLLIFRTSYDRHDTVFDPFRPPDNSNRGILAYINSPITIIYARTKTEIETLLDPPDVDEQAKLRARAMPNSRLIPALVSRAPLSATMSTYTVYL